MHILVQMNTFKGNFSVLIVQSPEFLFILVFER